MMTVESVKRAKRAIRAGRAELELWMREHGHDIESMDAFNELGTAIGIVDALAKELARAIGLLDRALEAANGPHIDDARALVAAHKAMVQP